MFILKILVIVMIYWKPYIINELWNEGWSILKHYIHSILNQNMTCLKNMKIYITIIIFILNFNNHYDIYFQCTSSSNSLIVYVSYVST